MHHFMMMRPRRAATSNPLRVDTAFYEHNVIDPANASATFQLSSAGVASGTGGSSYNWLSSGAPANYEVLATVTAGTLSSGTTGSWQALSSTRSWNVSRTTIGTRTATITIQIRETANPTVTDSGSITLTASVDF